MCNRVMYADFYSITDSLPDGQTRWENYSLWRWTDSMELAQNLCSPFVRVTIGLNGFHECVLLVRFEASAPLIWCGVSGHHWSLGQLTCPSLCSSCALSKAASGQRPTSKRDFKQIALIAQRIHLTSSKSKLHRVCELRDEMKNDSYFHWRHTNRVVNSSGCARARIIYLWLWCMAGGRSCCKWWKRVLARARTSKKLIFIWRRLAIRFVCVNCCL